MEKDKELEKKKSEVPARISGDKQIPAGFEEVAPGDIKVARLGIAQGLSQVCIDGKAKMGELFNTITSEIYGESVEIIPLFMFKTRAQFDTERGLVMMSRDNIKVTMAIDEFAEYLDKPVEEVPGAAWSGDEPPSFSQVYNFPCLLVSRLIQFPLSLSLMRTAVKTAKTFLSMARYSGEDMFARVYKVSSEIVKGTKGTYALPVIEFVKRCSDEEYAIAKKWFDGLYRRKADIEVELEDGDKEAGE
jgi:hypothetical protein